ncbi:hypothetical protein, partial [Streptomyces sp. NPDC000405]|uniref:hypothetical protein n=1 Tax=Streptomyces sp. NPDC000405 TaxID=3161033 RepID=UPI00398C9DCF
MDGDALSGRMPRRNAGRGGPARTVSLGYVGRGSGVRTGDTTATGQYTVDGNIKDATTGSPSY